MHVTSILARSHETSLGDSTTSGRSIATRCVDVANRRWAGWPASTAMAVSCARENRENHAGSFGPGLFFSLFSTVCACICICAYVRCTRDVRHSVRVHRVFLRKVSCGTARGSRKEGRKKRKREREGEKEMILRAKRSVLYCCTGLNLAFVKLERNIYFILTTSVHYLQNTNRNIT